MRLDADLLEPDVLGARRSSHGDQQLARPHLPLLCVHAHAVARLLRALHAHADPTFDAGFLECVEHLFRDLFVLERDQAIERLEQCDLDAQLVVQGRELDPDRAGADDADRLRDALRAHRVVGRDDVFAVDLEAGQ